MDVDLDGNGNDVGAEGEQEDRPGPARQEGGEMEGGGQGGVQEGGEEAGAVVGGEARQVLRRVPVVKSLGERVMKASAFGQYELEGTWPKLL